MDWTPYLEPHERLRWQGRPAPRCFTFRRWRLSVYGILLLLLSVFVFAVSIPLGNSQGWHLLPAIPFPFVLLGLYLSVGHLLLARREWEGVFFAVTDRRILAQRGAWRKRIESMRLEEARYYIYRPFGRELGSFSVHGGEPERTMSISCIEHPRALALLLEEALAKSPSAECFRLFCPFAGESGEDPHDHQQGIDHQRFGKFALREGEHAEPEAHDQ